MVFDSDMNDSAFSGGGSSSGNLEERLLAMKYTAMFNTEVRNHNDLCWDLCIDKAGAKLDQKTEMCLSNCVERFFDASKFIRQKLIQSLQGSAAWK